MQKLYLKDREVMTIAIQNEIVRNPEARYDHRLHGVLMVANGMSCYEVAGMLGHSPRTIESWVNDFNDTGFSALYDRQRSGRPSSISEEVMDRIAIDLRNDPHDSGYRQNMWDGILLKRHLSDHYGVEIGVRQCQNIFHKLGFRLRKPRPMIANGDEEEKGNFKKTR